MSNTHVSVRYLGRRVAGCPASWCWCREKSRRRKWRGKLLSVLSVPEYDIEFRATRPIQESTRKSCKEIHSSCAKKEGGGKEVTNRRPFRKANIANHLLKHPSRIVCSDDVSFAFNS